MVTASVTIKWSLKAIILRVCWAEAAAFSYSCGRPFVTADGAFVKKPQLGVFVLAGTLVVAIAGSSLLGAALPGHPGGARHGLHQRAPGLAGAGAPSRATAGTAQAPPDRSAVRAVLAARLAATERVKAARRRRRPVTVRLCHRFQHVEAFDADGAGLVVRNDNYGGLRECLAAVNRRANFAVTSSAARRPRREPAAFPNIFYGCSWGICSRATKLPRRLSRLRRPVTSWHTAGRPPGQWDAAYDIWFARHRHTSGQDHGTEIMLWLRTGGLGRPAAAQSLLIDRRRWQLEHWITTNPASGDHWPLIIFRMVRPHPYVWHLALMPFFRRVEALGLLHRSYWLTAVEAGFEVWRGGTGLRTTSFSVRP